MGEDALIIGRAKTGTTFLARSVAGALGADTRYLSEPKTPDEAMAGAGAAPRAVKIIFEHWDEPALRTVIENPAFGARLAIVRDPRDEYVSRALFMVRAEIWSGRAGRRQVEAWADVLRKKEDAPRATSFSELMAAYGRIFPDAKGAPGLKNFARGFERYLDFLDAAEMARVRYETFASGDFGEVSAATGRTVAPATDLGGQWYTKRGAGAGDWRRLFTIDDLERLQAELGAVVARAGYDDWALDPDPVLDPAHFSGYVGALWRHFASRPGGWRVRLGRVLQGLASSAR
ncbi:MAG: hypothetical protein AAFR11_06950 [Pseudomonadota bacterium]